MKKFTYISIILLMSVKSFAQGHFEVAYEGNGQDHMNIFVVSATINGETMLTGDEIAVFDGTVCCGKTTLSAKIVFSDAASYASLNASRKDEGEANGYTIGHEITFKLWDAGNNRELSRVTAEFINPANLQPITPPTYAPGATVFVKLSVIVSENKAPEANAGTDQTVDENSICTLDGSASSDADGNTLTYLWTAPVGITLSSNTVAKPTFTAPEVNADTQYTFSLVVNDGTLNSQADQVVITVKHVNKVPVANAGLDQTVDENSVCTLDGSASSDPDGNMLTYLWTAPVGITLSSTTVAKPTFSVPEVKQDTVLNFSLTVSDGITYSEPSTVKIFVVNVIKTGLNISDADEIRIYPNPSKGIISIEGLNANNQSEIKIYTIAGKLIRQEKSKSKRNKVDISGELSGMYLLVIDEKPYKIIKE